MAKTSLDSVTWNGTTSLDTVTWADVSLPTGSGDLKPGSASSGSGLRSHFDLGTSDDISPSVSVSGSGTKTSASHFASGSVFAVPGIVGSGFKRHVSTSGALVSHPAISGSGTSGATVTHPATGTLTARPTVSGAVGTLRHFGTGAVSPVITVTNTPAVQPFPPFSGIPPGKGASNVDGDEELRRRAEMFFREKLLRRLDEDVKDAMEALLKIL